jgi:hypothetical protein
MLIAILIIICTAIGFWAGYRLAYLEVAVTLQSARQQAFDEYVKAQLPDWEKLDPDYFNG